MAPTASDYINNEISKTLVIKYKEDNATGTVNYPIKIKNVVSQISMSNRTNKQNIQHRRHNIQLSRRSNQSNKKSRKHRNISINRSRNNTNKLKHTNNK